MAISMTGYGRAEGLSEDINFLIESKSVNHRYLDINIRMPKKFSFAEEEMKKIVKKYIKRGRVDLFVSYEKLKEENFDILLDLDLADKYHKSLLKLGKEINLKTDDVKIMDVAKFPEVVKLKEKEENEDLIMNTILEATKQSIKKLFEMRALEGKKLEEDIKLRCETLKEYMEKIEKLSDTVVLDYKEKLENRIKDILDSNIEIDENKMAHEVAFFADRSNITEEIVRFKSHIQQLQKTIDEDDAVGRKLDFLIQEMNREVNTVGSKSSNLDITNLVVNLKSELEKIREQIQNIE
ncbi:MAG: YicC family protein [Peptostreptococcaceae bacterium]|nr:YicC family protein [Peptostreptococcaceae bacterium]